MQFILGEGLDAVLNEVRRLRRGELEMSPGVDFGFSRDSRQLILGGRQDGSLGVYDLASGREIRRLVLGSEAPLPIALHPDGRRLATFQGGQVTVRSLDTGAVLASWK